MTRLDCAARLRLLAFNLLLVLAVMPHAPRFVCAGPSIPIPATEKTAPATGPQHFDFSLMWNPGSTVGALDLIQLLETLRRGAPPGDFMSGEYDPILGLHLEDDGLVLDVPPGALAGQTTLSIRRVTDSNIPVPLPGGVGFSGGELIPDGQVFDVSPQIRVRLSAPTILPMLPVLLFDPDQNSWKGAGTLATVLEGGMEAEFQLGHFSIPGVPDAVPIPDPGEAIGSFVVLSGNGNLQSQAISSASASLLYSEFGDTFNIAAMSQEINNQGMVKTKALGLDAILVFRIENYLIGVVGGGASLYNQGQFNEPIVGVMIMSVTGGAVSLSFYSATPNQVIQGTLTGQT